MRFKLSFSLVFYFLLTQFALNAQIKYSSEELTKVYETETIVLMQNSYEKNGVETPFNPVFPNGALRLEIEKNGGKEANIQYKKYLKSVGDYWLVSAFGLILALGPLFAVGKVTGASLGLLLGISLVGSLVLAIGTIFILKKLWRHLAYSVWHHNKNVLLNKP
jgi:hypothetical protein